MTGTITSDAMRRASAVAATMKTRAHAIRGRRGTDQDDLINDVLELADALEELAVVVERVATEQLQRAIS